MVMSIWEQIHSQRSWGRYPNEELVRFIGKNFFRIPREKRKSIKILELGCGQGANLWFLAKEGFDVYGVDISPSAIKKAKDYLERDWGIKSVKLNVQDIRTLQIEDEMFDVVIDVATIWYVSYTDHKKVFEKIFRLLKLNGYFWSFHIAENSWGYGTGNLIDYKTFDNISSEGPLQNQGITCMLSAKDIKILLETVGFKVTGIEKLVRTYENQQKKLIFWIVEAVKP
jgi:cyclopropane fatty-acyl-phospholipid synthase-like methyltransferase